MPIIIPNRVIPWPGYKCINILGLLFIREGQHLSQKDITHETIHTRQGIEMGWIGFYLWYVLEWIIKGFSYYDISFEREAYQNQGNPDYLKTRKFWSFTRYLRKREN